MLSLLQQFDFAFFSIFGYVTTRVVLAAITAFFLMMVIMPRLIKWLHVKKYGEQGAKGDGAIVVDRMRQAKAGTPTMGGLGLIVCIMISAVLWCDPNQSHTWLLLFTIFAFGVLGFLDDRTKIFKGAEGLSVRVKMILQLFVGIACGVWLYYIDLNASAQIIDQLKYKVHPDNGSLILDQVIRGDMTHYLSIPMIPLEYSLYLGIGIVLWVVVMTFACSNSVNFTDGMDGLASGTMLIAAMAFVVIAYACSRIDAASYLRIFYVPGAQEVAVFCAAICGACLGFLWFNAAPAEIFMGDTGSQALGGALAVVATSVKQEFLLPVVGFVFFIEGGSVMLQVAYFKMTKGKRMFLCAPLHHHFQYKGWPETKIVLRFWVLAALTAIFAIATLKLR